MPATPAHGTTTPSHRDAADTVVDNIRHPVASRIADVLRSRTSTPRVFVIDDEENILQAVRHGVRLDSLYFTASMASAPASIRTAIPAAVPSYALSGRVATWLFDEEKRSRVFALARRPPQPTLRDLTTRNGDLVVLDGVRLVGNIGAIIRSACALGAAGVVLLDSGLRTIVDRRLVRASRGLVFAIPVVLSSRREFGEYVRRERLGLAAVTADASTPLSAIRAAPDRLALVVGGERHGISPELDALTSHRYAIPMAPDVESLNVSVAAAIALYEHRRA